MPSLNGIVKVVAVATIAAFVFIPDSGLGHVVWLAFLAFLIATVLSAPKVLRQFNFKGLKRLRDVFPRK